MARKVHGGRALLNLPGHHSTAAIVAEIDDTADWPKMEHPSGDVYEQYNVAPTVICKITDCDHQINIECDFSTANHLENSLYKLDVIVQALTDLREGLIVEHHRLHDRLAYVPADRRLGRYGSRRLEGKRSTTEWPSTTSED